MNFAVAAVVRKHVEVKADLARLRPPVIAALDGFTGEVATVVRHAIHRRPELAPVGGLLLAELLLAGGEVLIGGGVLALVDLRLELANLVYCAQLDALVAFRDGRTTVRGVADVASGVTVDDDRIEASSESSGGSSPIRATTTGTRSMAVAWRASSARRSTLPK